MFILQVIGYVIFVYGLLSLIQDIIEEFTYKRVSHHMKIIVFVEALEKNLEQFMIELTHMKKINPYKQLIVVDLDENDNIKKLQEKFWENEVNVEILNKSDGKELLTDIMENND